MNESSRGRKSKHLVYDFLPGQTNDISEHYDNEYAVEQWTSPTSHQLFHHPEALLDAAQIDGAYMYESSGAYYRDHEPRFNPHGSAMLPGLFDRRVHHKYRKQINFETWYREDPDWLFGCICPADLCDMPCQWDEIGGCQMFRLCKIRQKYPNPIHGQRPPCDRRTKNLCDAIHNIIEPNCRSLGKQVASADSGDWQFCSYQVCEHVAALVSSSNVHTETHCRWGHDYEACRLVAIWMYWVHTALACRLGASGKVQRRDNVHAWVPFQPDIETLHDLRIIDNGAVEGFTFHDHKVVLPWDVYQYFLDRHERRALTVGLSVGEPQLEEGSVPALDWQSDDWSANLRRATSWSSLATSTTQKPGVRVRSGSMSV